MVRRQGNQTKKDKEKSLGERTTSRRNAHRRFEKRQEREERIRTCVYIYICERKG